MPPESSCAGSDSEISFCRDEFCPCTTTNGDPCILPFNYHGTDDYDVCPNTSDGLGWCPTEIGADGIFHTGSHSYGTCAAGCPGQRQNELCPTQSYNSGTDRNN